MRFYPYRCILIGALTLSLFSFVYPAALEKASDSRVEEQPPSKKRRSKIFGAIGNTDAAGPFAALQGGLNVATKKEFSDEAMAYLPSLSGLEWLEIGGGKITSAGMAHLKDCPALKRLFIHDINLSSDSLQWLSSLTRLESLSLQHTGITGSILGNIKAVDTLTVLNLSGNPINDDALASIARIKGLEVLGLADTKVTGLGIEKLRGMPRLNELNVMHCNIQDQDLEVFLSTPNLRIVYAEGCPLSDYGVMNTISRFSMLAIFR